jgi:hypothetical protein
MCSLRSLAAGSRYHANHSRDPRSVLLPMATVTFTPNLQRLVQCESTRDGGEHFETLSGGLPGNQSWDIVYQHALDLHGDGRTLAMGSTTGSVWISEDGGEQWQVVSEHLPPVYALRFEN